MEEEKTAVNQETPEVKPEEKETSPAESAPAEETQQEKPAVEADEATKVKSESEEELTKIKALREERRKIAADLEAKKAEKEATASEANTQPQQGEATPEEMLKKIINDTFDEQWQKKESEITNKAMSEVEEKMKWDENMKSLRNKYNGKDGAPKFDEKEVVEYAKKKQIFNLESAYRDMNYEKLMEVHARKVKNSIKEGTFVEPPSVNSGTLSSPTNQDEKITQNNLEGKVLEMLKDGVGK